MAETTGRGPSAMRRSGAGRMPVESNSGTCPCLVPVLDDRLCVYPGSVYCRPSGGGVRIPALDTLMRLCTGEYARCPRYKGDGKPEEVAST